MLIFKQNLDKTADANNTYMYYNLLHGRNIKPKIVKTK